MFNFQNISTLFKLLIGIHNMYYISYIDIIFIYIGNLNE